MADVQNGRQDGKGEMVVIDGKNVDCFICSEKVYKILERTFF